MRKPTPDVEVEIAVGIGIRQWQKSYSEGSRRTVGLEMQRVEMGMSQNGLSEIGGTGALAGLS
jgi:hypothetical protein